MRLNDALVADQVDPCKELACIRLPRFHHRGVVRLCKLLLEYFLGEKAQIYKWFRSSLYIGAVLVREWMTLDAIDILNHESHWKPFIPLITRNALYEYLIPSKLIQGVVHSVISIQLDQCTSQSPSCVYSSGGPMRRIVCLFCCAKTRQTKRYTHSLCMVGKSKIHLLSSILQW